MPAFFIILLKINLVLVLFAVAYYLILRQLTFYIINRVFLVFAILFSTVYPFIDLSDFFQRQSPQAVAFVPNMNQQIQSFVKPTLLDKYWLWLSVLFFVGVFLMVIRLIIQFISLYNLHQKSRAGNIANFKVRILSQAVSPFSFWQTVYINPALHPPKELQTILAHEQIHVKEWHSLDIILAELSVVFYWFNPGVWLIKKAVKENLEFIADEKTLKKGIDKKTYQYGLLNVGKLVPAASIVNNFNLLDLKKRIKMMNVKRSSKLTLSRYLLVLPLLLLVTLAFTVSKNDMNKHLEPVNKALISTPILDGPQLAAKKPTVNNKFTPNKLININLTTQRIKLLINVMYTSKDSVNLTNSQNIDRKFLHKQDETNIHGFLNLNGKVSILSTDTLNLTTKAPQFDQVNMFVARGVMLNSNVPQFDQKAVEFRGYKTDTKLADSIKNSIFLNGEKLTVEQLNEINPDAIKTINIRKNKNTHEIHIIGYSQKNNP